MKSNFNSRRSIRLKEYDYSEPGFYFITTCVHDKACLFGKIAVGRMYENNAGKMIAFLWEKLTARFHNIQLHDFIVMPNHFHGIIEIVEVSPAGTENPPTIGSIVGTFKSLTTNNYIQNVKQNNWPRFKNKLWQRNYYEHIIQNDESFCEISDHIQHNALKWENDKYYV